MRNRLKATLVVIAFVGAAAACSPSAPPSASAPGLDRAAEERALLALIEGPERMEMTEDFIFVSGAYPQPLIGRAAVQANRNRREQIQQLRPNLKDTSTRLQLFVSESGDMAYEYGLFRMSWDAPEGGRTEFEGTYLEVYRKENGQWKRAASFARPNEPEPAPATGTR